MPLTKTIADCFYALSEVNLVSGRYQEAWLRVQHRSCKNFVASGVETVCTRNLPMVFGECGLEVFSSNFLLELSPEVRQAKYHIRTSVAFAAQAASDAFLADCSGRLWMAQMRASRFTKMWVLGSSFSSGTATVRRFSAAVLISLSQRGMRCCRGYQLGECTFASCPSFVKLLLSVWWVRFNVGIGSSGEHESASSAGRKLGMSNCRNSVECT